MFHLFRRFGLFIDHRIGEFLERFVGVLFLGEGCIEELELPRFTRSHVQTASLAELAQSGAPGNASGSSRSGWRMSLDHSVTSRLRCGNADMERGPDADAAFCPIRPLWASTIPLQIVSPNPAPDRAPRSVRQKRSKM